MGREVLEVQSYQMGLHALGTCGAEGVCSWLCREPAVYSVRIREVSGSETVFALCDDHRRRVEEVYGSAAT